MSRFHSNFSWAVQTAYVLLKSLRSHRFQCLDSVRFAFQFSKMKTARHPLSFACYDSIKVLRVDISDFHFQRKISGIHTVFQGKYSQCTLVRAHQQRHIAHAFAVVSHSFYLTDHRFGDQTFLISG